MKVTARITAKKANDTESIVDRQSSTAIFLDAGNGSERVSVIVRADGYIDIEVRTGGVRSQAITLRNGFTFGPSIIDGESVAA